MEEKKLVLLVDDEPDVIEHVGSILKKNNFEVVSASKGKEALELALIHKPDIILLDVFLPDIDGGEVASRLTLNPQTKDIPIIYLTGLITKQEQEVPEKIGKYFVIAKPILESELIPLIQKVLS